jgi:hypothetical protein
MHGGFGPKIGLGGLQGDDPDKSRDRKDEHGCQQALSSHGFNPFINIRV